MLHFGVMPSDAALLWSLAGLTLLLLAGLFWVSAARARSRRTRNLRRLREMSRSQPQPLAPNAGAGESEADVRLESIRLDAENAARLAAMGVSSEKANPFAEGSREHVIWLATFHICLAELEERERLVRENGETPPQAH
ncbi:MAG: hypothetical protein KGL68_01995 [Burkholderiales bacterium]|nr:hypothetical protein [Burkholderiales bacterium]